MNIHNDLQLEVRIGLARPDELEAIWNIYESVCLATYPNEEAGFTEQAIKDYLAFEEPGFAERWQKAITHPSLERTVFVARVEDEIVGMISRKVADGNYRITSLYIANNMQRKGIGTLLLNHALEWCGNHDVYLYVAPYLKNPQRLYEKHGFHLLDTPLTLFEGNPVGYVEMMRPAGSHVNLVH